ncbi:MAG: peroxiredoxin family protein [Granulosicoccus sp.]|nr:peroxiredoxin family protein [Granulosicoccus sp.]
MEKINRRRRKIFLGGVATLSGSTVWAASDTSTDLPDRYGIRGYEAPEITLDYWIDGEGAETTFSVKAARGKWVFLKYFQNWCPGCHSSGFPTLKAFCDAFYGHPEVEIAAVQTVFEGRRSNTQYAVRELQLRYRIPATMGHDPGDEAGDFPAKTMIEYRTGGTPWLVLIDPAGTVVFNDFHVDRQKLINYVRGQIA